MGITGYSQGGAGAIAAVTKHKNWEKYNELFTASASYPLLAKNMGWGYEPSDLNISYFMTESTGKSADTGESNHDKSKFAGVAPLESLVEIYDAMSQDVIKIRARCKDAEHFDMVYRTDGYMAAWFLYHLQGNKEAGSALFGENAKILNNFKWQDVKVNK